MKLAIISDEISQDLQTACEFIVRYGLQGVEIRSVKDKNSFDFERKDMQEMAQIIQDYGLQVPAIASPFFKCAYDEPREIQAHLDGLRKTIELAHCLNADLIRGFSFWADADPKPSLEAIAERFQEPIRYLKDAGKVMVLEADPSVCTPNAQELSKLVRAIDSPWIKVLWDPGNEIYDLNHGETPYPNAYDRIRPWIAHVHIKDARRTPKGDVECCRIGDGSVDYPGQLVALRQSGYKGFLSLETHYRKNAHLTDALLKMPKGGAFTAGAYEATQESLESLLQIMESL